MSALEAIHQKKREQGKDALSDLEEAILTVEECGFVSLAGDAAEHLVRLIDQNRRFIDWHMEQGRIISELRQKLASQNVVIDAARGLLDYRKQAGALNFQLEKADDYLHEIRIALDALKEQKA